MSSLYEDKAFLELNARRRVTPDFMELRDSDDPIYVFVYGKHERGSFQFPLALEDKSSSFLGRGLSAQRQYALRKYLPQGGNISVQKVLLFHLLKSNASTGHALGDIFCVTPETMLKLDRLLLNNFQTKRQLKWFKLLDQEVMMQDREKTRRPYIKAWVWLSDWEYYEDCGRHTRIYPVSPVDFQGKPTYTWFPLKAKGG